MAKRHIKFFFFVVVFCFLCVCPGIIVLSYLYKQAACWLVDCRTNCVYVRDVRLSTDCLNQQHVGLDLGFIIILLTYIKVCMGRGWESLTTDWFRAGQAGLDPGSLINHSTSFQIGDKMLERFCKNWSATWLLFLGLQFSLVYWDWFHFDLVVFTLKAVALLFLLFLCVVVFLLYRMFCHGSELVVVFFCLFFFLHLCCSLVYTAAVGTHDAFSLNISASHPGCFLFRCRGL